MPEFLQASIQVLLGIALLFGGGELFVQGSVAMAVIFGIPQLVIGLTVVSLGTSAPELFVSLSSVLQGADALAVSNVVGSNIFNVMVVLGSSALVLPLRVESRLVSRDGNHQRHISPHKAAFNAQGQHKGAAAQHHHHVEYVAAHHIAHGEGVSALQHRTQAHEQFRGAGAQRHHREADYELGNPEDHRNGDGPLNEQFSATEQQSDAQ